MSNPEHTVPIIRTKLHRPSVTPDYVTRDALDAALEAGADLPLTVVSAPAGYGKSTLVSHWLETSGHPGGWLSLNESDSDVRVFLTYLVAALETLSAGACEKTRELLTSENLPPSTVVAAHLSNDLDELGGRVVLVLDDYHHIHDPNIHSILDRVLEHPSAHLHMVILSRIDPMLSLARLRAGNKLNEIRMRALRFSEEETSSFFTRATGDPLKSSIIHRIQESTEGWPVGIRLAALAMHYQEDAETFLTNFEADARPLREYLLAEVLSGQSPTVRANLLSTSILSRFNASLCEAVWSSSDTEHEVSIRGNEFLETLEKSGLFCISLDDRNEWFRFHHIFTDLLKRQLEESQCTEHISKLHLRASRWFAEYGYYEEAIQHALTGGDEEAAAHIVGVARHDLMNQDNWHELDRWLMLFPENAIEKQPQLVAARCWLEGLHRYRLDLLVRDLDLADTLLEDLHPTEAVQMKAEISALRSGFAYWTLKLADSVALAKRSLGGSPAENECVRSTALSYQGVAHQALGELEQSESLLLDSIEGAGFSEPSSHARLLQSLCFAYWPEADTQKLKRAATSLLELSLEHKQMWSLSFARYFLGLNHYERNELVDAVAQLEPIVDDPYRYPIQNVLHCSFVLSLCFLAQGLRDRAREVAESIEKLTFERGHRMFIDLSEAFRAELDLRNGYLTRAERWAKNFTAPPPHQMHRFFNAEFTALKVKIAQHGPVSTDQLDSLHRLLTQCHNRRLTIDVLGLKSIAAARDGNIESALSLLREALFLAQPGQLIRPLADLGPEMAKLLGRLDLDQEGSRYAGLITSALQEPTGASAEHQPLPEPLSQRELEILALLAQDLSNKEIATRLFISIGTVKQHTHNIYGKLSVNRRRAAVLKAQSLSLLEKA